METKKEKTPPIIVICGPTASGKTNVAIVLAKLFAGEIVGADSMQIYRQMDIGTAKPTADERNQIPHYMIDIVNPDEPFDAVQYQKKARDYIGEIHARGKIPFIVGGTGLYMKALLQGMFESVTIPPEIRTSLRNRLETEGSVSLHQELQKKDPDMAQKLHPNDSYRIIRALEMILATGKTMSAYQKEHQFKSHFYRTLKIGMSVPREILYERIDRRVDKMISEGFLTEVKHLIDVGYDPQLKSMQSIGYRHAAAFLQDKIKETAWIEQMKQDTRRYAKRQMTWFTGDKEIHWIAPEQIDEMSLLIESFLQTSRDNER